MGRVILCMGEYADNPYYIEQAGLSIYSVEELCYYLHENAYLLDRDILTIKLVEWIAKECKLELLAKELMDLLRKKVSLAIFVRTILERIHYCKPKELAELESILKESDSLNVIEKRKASADYFAKKGKLKRALSEYTQLVAEVGNTDEILLSRIYHNIGTIYATLYEFSKAAQYYLKAYQTGYENKSYVSYLLAMRMEMPQEEYIRFITEDSKNYQYSLEIEKKVEQILLAMPEYEPKKELEHVKSFKNTQYASEYYTQIETIINDWKENYRNYVEE